MLKTFLSIFLLVVIVARTCEAVVVSGSDVTETPIKAQVVKHQVSGESNVVKLKCNILKNSFKKNKIISINEMKWEHKKCGYGLHLINCGNSLQIPWTPVMCKNGSKFCDGYTLKLENPRPSDGGYYRCLYKNYMSKQFKVYKVFHVDIYDAEASFEILDEPVEYENNVAHVNDTITFQCRARSLFPLYMIWAKLVHNEAKINPSIQYGTNTYELLNNSGCYYVGNDLYISKLKLNNCQISDSGKYYCIVISVNNAQMMKNKTSTLTVIPRMHDSNYSAQSSVSIQLVFIWICLISPFL